MGLTRISMLGEGLGPSNPPFLQIASYASTRLRVRLFEVLLHIPLPAFYPYLSPGRLRGNYPLRLDARFHACAII